MLHAALKVGSSLLALSLVLGVSGVARADDEALPPPPPAATGAAPVAPQCATQVQVIVVETRPSAEARPTGDAQTQPTGETAREKPVAAERPSSWYGYQTMAVDGAAVAMASTAMTFRSGPLAASAVMTYVFGAPIVHLVHGSGAKFAGDLGMRLGGPVLGAITGGALGVLGSDDSLYGVLAWGLVGFSVGGVAAMVVDYTVLSNEPKKEEKWDGKVRVSPNVAATPQGASVGVGGAF